MHTITLHIPTAKYGAIATAAALRGVDISQWVKRRMIKAALATPTTPAPAPTKEGESARVDKKVQPASAPTSKEPAT